MRRRYITMLALVLVLIVPATLSAITVKDTWHRSFSVDEGVEFILVNVNGGIKIEGWDGDEIDVHADIKIKAPSKSKAQQILDKLKFRVDAESDRVEISAKRPRLRQDGLFGGLFGGKTTLTIRYHVKVPRNIHLDIKNTNGGIDVSDAEGTFDLETVNGGITVDSFRGEGKAHTVNGGIDCSIERFAPGGELSLKTTNGGIGLKLPDDAGARLEAKTVNGGIDLDIKLHDTIRIKRRSVRGIIGDGDGEVFLKTVNGGIDIEPY